MKLVETIMEKSPCYATHRKIHVEGIMVHSNHSPQPSAKVMIHNWNRESFSRACVHAFIDGNDGTVYQTLPWAHRGWHAFGSANNNHIGIEICEPSSIRYTGKNQIEVVNKDAAVASAEKTYRSAVELCAQLCVKYNLDPLTAICSHTEGHKKGIASDRVDPEHLWSGLELPFTMDTFRQAVRDEMDKIVRDPVTQEIPEEPIVIKVTEVSPSEIITEHEQDPETIPLSLITEGEQVPEVVSLPLITEGEQIPEVVQLAVEEAPKVQKVRIDVDRLRIRTGPGIDFPTTGKYTGKGIFEITEVQGATEASHGWGKLQNGNGWICLDYVTPYEG